MSFMDNKNICLVVLLLKCKISVYNFDCVYVCVLCLVSEDIEPLPHIQSYLNYKNICLVVLLLKCKISVYNFDCVYVCVLCLVSEEHLSGCQMGVM